MRSLKSWGLILTLKVVPTFSLDFTSICPPRYSLILLHIVKPRPIPYRFIPAEDFNFPKILKSLDMLSLLIPMPVSFTLNTSYIFLFWLVVKSILYWSSPGIELLYKPKTSLLFRSSLTRSPLYTRSNLAWISMKPFWVNLMALETKFIKI